MLPNLYQLFIHYCKSNLLLAVPINCQPSTVVQLFYFSIHTTELRAEIERLTGLLGINGAPLTSFTAGQLFQNSTSHASDMEELQKKLREAEKLMVECTRYGWHDSSSTCTMWCHDRTWEERLLKSERRKQEEAEELKVIRISWQCHVQWMFIHLQSTSIDFFCFKSNLLLYNTRIVVVLLGNP